MSKGSPYNNLERALKTGNLAVMRAAAAELPTINLEDALSICLLLARQEPRHFERKALRWIGRYCLERRGLTVEDVRDVAGAFTRLRDDDDAAAPLLAVGDRTGCASGGTPSDSGNIEMTVRSRPPWPALTLALHSNGARSCGLSP